ncbi:MAG: hypothetical protein FWC25_02400 [Dehalococcoidia bacterium]|nr:hypothetical protein [Dehalococcoidia bacterium]
MEIKQVDEYEKPKFNTFQLKTGKILLAGAACITLLSMSGILEGCSKKETHQESLPGMYMATDFMDETSTTTSSEPLLTFTTLGTPLAFDP